jgi:hypothetical protein
MAALLRLAAESQVTSAPAAGVLLLIVVGIVVQLLIRPSSACRTRAVVPSRFLAAAHALDKNCAHPSCFFFPGTRTQSWRFFLTELISFLQRSVPSPSPSLSRRVPWWSFPAMAAPASLLLSLFCSDPYLWSFIPLPASSAGAQASSSSIRGARNSCSPSFFQPRRRLAARPSARHFVHGHHPLSSPYARPSP